MASDVFKLTFRVDDKGTAKILKLGNITKAEAKKIQKAFDDMHKGSKKTSKAFGLLKNKILALAGATAIIMALRRAVSGLIRSMGEWVKLSNIQEDAVRNLNSSLAATGQLTEELSQNYQDLASSIQTSTRHGDEAILGTMATLTRLGGVTEENMGAATMAVLNWAEAFKQGNLESASLDIAKALSGNVMMLQRYGVRLESTATQQEVLAAVMLVTGNIAEDMARTYVGRMKQMSDASGDVKEKLGDVLKAGIYPMLEPLTQLAVKLGDFVAENKVAALRIMRTAFGTLVGVITLVVNALGLGVIALMKFSQAGSEWAARAYGEIRDLIALLGNLPSAVRELMGLGDVDLLDTVADLTLAQMAAQDEAKALGRGIDVTVAALAAMNRAARDSIAGLGDMDTSMMGLDRSARDAGDSVEYAAEQVAMIDAALGGGLIAMDAMFRANQQLQSDFRSMANTVDEELTEGFILLGVETGEVDKSMAAYVSTAQEAKFGNNQFAESTYEAAASVGALQNAVASFASGGSLLDLGKQIAGIFAGDIAGGEGIGGALSNLAGGLFGAKRDKFGKLSIGMSGGDAAMGGIGTFFSMLGDKSKGMGEKIGASLGTGIGSYFGGPIGGAIAGKVGGWLGKLFGGKAGWQKASDAISKQFEGISQELADTIGKDKKAAGSLAAAINQNYGAILDELIPKHIEMGTVGSAAWNELIQGAKDAGIAVDQLLRESIGPFLEQAATGLNKLWDSFSGKGPKAMEMFGRVGQEIFDALLANGYSFIEALELVGDAGGEAFSELNTLVEENANLFQRLEGVNDIMEGLGSAGALTTQTFRDMQNVAFGTFNQLVDKGMESDQVIMAMIPTLKVMKDAHERLGFPINKNTQSLIDQAEGMGLLKGSGDVVVDSINLLTVTIADAFGIQIPNAIRKSVDELWNMGTAGTAAADATSNSFTEGADTIANSFGEATDIMLERIAGVSEGMKDLPDEMRGEAESAINELQAFLDNANLSVSIAVPMVGGFGASGGDAGSGEGGSGPRLPPPGRRADIPEFADGGMFRAAPGFSAGLAIMHDREIATPEGRQGGSIGQQVINIVTPTGEIIKQFIQREINNREITFDVNNLTDGA